MVFDPMNTYLDFAQHRYAGASSGSILGMAACLERLGIGYRFVEPSDREAMAGLRIVFLPWALVVSMPLAGALLDFAADGGTIVCEAETDSFDAAGFHLRPGPERHLMSRLGVAATGRRAVDIEQITVLVGDRPFDLRPHRWLTPLRSDTGSVAVPGVRLSAARDIIGDRTVATRHDPGGVIILDDLAAGACAAYVPRINGKRTAEIHIAAVEEAAAR